MNQPQLHSNNNFPFQWIKLQYNLRQNNKMPELRQKIERLRKYQIFKSFNFLQLSYLTQNSQQKTFTYKDYLYTQGSLPTQIYLIQQGEFQFTSFFRDNQQAQIRNKLKQKLSRDRKLSKQKNQPIDFQESSFYNTIKPSKVKQFRVGTVIGGMGQSIGEQQIILNKQKRRYNAKCTSTNNHVIVIKKEHLTKVLNDNGQILAKLKFQLSERQKITHQAHLKLYSVRNNRDSLVKLLVKQTLSKEKGNTLSTERLTEDKSLKFPILQRKNQTQMRRKKQELREKLHLRASNDSLISKQKIIDDKKSKTFFVSESDIPEKTFMLTDFDRSGSEVIKKQQTKFIKLKQPQDKIQWQKTLALKSSKSQNAKQMSPRRLLSKQKYNGIIDSSLLVREKQRIVQMRKNHNQISDRTEFQQRYLKLWKQNLLQKERARQSSTVHSKQYMQKMLLTALKKAGYQQAIPQLQKKSQRTQHKKTLTQVSNFSTQNINQENNVISNSNSQTKHLKLQKIALKIKKKRKAFFEPVTEILQSNPFDECYFNKIK